MPKLFLYLLLFSCGLFTSLGADAKRVLKPEDFAALRDVDEPNLSPDRNTVAYVVGTVDLAKDKQPRNLWRAKSDNSEHRPVTYGEHKQAQPAWRRDGKRPGSRSG